jgi:hypothetical protein
VDQVVAKQDAKLAKDLDKYFELRDWHDQTVAILHKEFHAKKDFTELTIEQFGFQKLKADYLKGFIHVRTFDSVEKPKTFKWPNRGQTKDALAGVNCLVLLAYKCRQSPEKLITPPAKPEPPERKPSRHLSATVLRSSGAIKFASPDYVGAPTLLLDRSWCAKVCNALCLNGENQQQIDDLQLENASLLQKMLLRCLDSHVARKVDSDKVDHWCLHLTAAKLGYMAAIMVLFGQVKEDLSCIPIDMCLLASKSNF